MRLMSFSMTLDQVRAQTKTETRRNGWKYATVGMRVVAVEKAMGLKPGERIQPLSVVEFTEVSREPLEDITRMGCVIEGFPNLQPSQFIEFYRRHNKPTPDGLISRIRFRYIENHELTPAELAQWHRLNEAAKGNQR